MFRMAKRGVPVLLLCLLPLAASAEREAALSALADGEAVLIMRHAQTVAGTGDPAGFRPDDCSTQRNLNEVGRKQARELGAILRAAGIASAAVYASPWCRAVETAELLALGPVRTSDLLSSIWNDRVVNPDRSEELRAFIRSWQGPGPLVLVTHGINIGRLLDRRAAQGGGLVLLAGAEGAETLRIVGRLP